MWRLYRLRKTVQVWRMQRRYPSGRCMYCDVVFEGDRNRQRTVDHVVPLSLGGTWRMSNLVFACAGCNRKKGCRPLSEFYLSPWLRQRRESVRVSQLAEEQR